MKHERNENHLQLLSQDLLDAGGLKTGSVSAQGVYEDERGRLRPPRADATMNAEKWNDTDPSEAPLELSRTNSVQILSCT